MTALGTTVVIANDVLTGHDKRIADALILWNIKFSYENNNSNNNVFACLHLITHNHYQILFVAYFSYLHGLDGFLWKTSKHMCL